MDKKKLWTALLAGSLILTSSQGDKKVDINEQNVPKIEEVNPVKGTTKKLLAVLKQEVNSNKEKKKENKWHFEIRFAFKKEESDF